MSTFKKSGHLTKIRTKNATFVGSGRLQVRYCERCRIKDGLSKSWIIRFGTCSFCGRQERVSVGLQRWQPKTVAIKKLGARPGSWR